MTTLIIATRNTHKVDEIRSMLDAERFRFLTLSDFPEAPPIVEDASTFEENAAKKSEGLVKWLQQQRPLRNLPEGETAFVLADDSGLEVDALNGAPGVHSARFAAMDTGAEGNSADADNNAKLLRLMSNVPPEKRTARFRCVLALSKLPSSAGNTDIETRLFAGSCEGRVAFAPSGGGGFGYDPLFIPDGFDKSFAELGESVKNQLSHRAKALQKLRENW